MNRLIVVIVVALAVFQLNTECFAKSNVHRKGYTEEQAEQIRQTAMSAFQQHKFNRSYHLFGDFCRLYPGSFDNLEERVNKSFEELQSRGHESPQKLKQLRSYLDSLLGLEKHLEFRRIAAEQVKSK